MTANVKKQLRGLIREWTMIANYIQLQCAKPVETESKRYLQGKAAAYLHAASDLKRIVKPISNNVPAAAPAAQPAKAV